jgi:hypothetical protein
MDFNFVTDRLATGAAISTVEDVSALVQAGITHVVSCREFTPEASWLRANSGILDYLHNPTLDDFLPKPSEWFRATINFALPALAFAGTKVYVHCNEGRNRGPSSAYAVLRAQGIAPAMAEKMIRDVRPIVTLAYIRDADKAIEALRYE